MLHYRIAITQRMFMYTCLNHVFVVLFGIVARNAKYKNAAKLHNQGCEFAGANPGGETKVDQEQ